MSDFFTFFSKIGQFLAGFWKKPVAGGQGGGGRGRSAPSGNQFDQTLEILPRARVILCIFYLIYINNVENSFNKPTLIFQRPPKFLGQKSGYPGLFLLFTARRALAEFQKPARVQAN